MFRHVHIHFPNTMSKKLKSNIQYTNNLVYNDCYLFLQRLSKGILRHFARQSWADMFIWQEPVLGLFIYLFIYLQLKGVVGLLEGHNTLRTYLHVTGLCEDLTCGRGKEFVMFPYTV